MNPTIIDEPLSETGILLLPTYGGWNATKFKFRNPGGARTKVIYGEPYRWTDGLMTQYGPDEIVGVRTTLFLDTPNEGPARAEFWSDRSSDPLYSWATTITDALTALGVS